MSDNQNPKPYDAVLGGQNIPKDAAVLGGIQGFQNPKWCVTLNRIYRYVPSLFKVLHTLQKIYSYNSLIHKTFAISPGFTTLGGFG